MTSNAIVLSVRPQYATKIIEGKYEQAGPHALTWKGIDDTGNKLPPGFYICKLIYMERTGKITTETRPIVLVK